MKKRIPFFVSLFSVLFPANDVGAQIDSCIQLNQKAPGIERWLSLSSNDSFYSHCLCFFYTQAHGVYVALNDSTLILTRTIPLDPPWYSMTTRIFVDSIAVENRYQLIDSNFFPIRNQELQITWRVNKDTIVITDSLGYLIFPLYKARRVGMVDSLGKIEAYIDIQDLKEKKNGVIQIGELKNEIVYKYYLIRTGIGTYQIKDIYSNEIVADGKVCQDTYDPKYDALPDK